MIKIYSATWCGPCASAKRLLDSLGQSYEEIDIEENNISREKLMEMTGGMTVPQIIINEKRKGLKKLDEFPIINWENFDTKK